MLDGLNVACRLCSHCLRLLASHETQEPPLGYLYHYRCLSWIGAHTHQGQTPRRVVRHPPLLRIDDVGIYQENPIAFRGHTLLLLLASDGGVSHSYILA